MAKETIGAFEEIVLLAVRSLGAEAYGANLQRVLEREARRPVSLGAVHTALERLEAKGMVASAPSAPTASRGGRSRRVFAPTRAGRAALADLSALRDRLTGLRAARSETGS